jgi:hypothetical protein
MGIGIRWLVHALRLWRADDPFRIQVAPKVSEIPGAIHKKFKTRAQALEAFHMAVREGDVRAVQVEPDEEVATISSPSMISVARDTRQSSRPRVPQVSNRDRKGSGGKTGETTRKEDAPNNASLRHPKNRMGSVTVGTELQVRCASEPYENLNHGLINVCTTLHSTGRAGPSSSRTGDQTRVLRHAALSSRGSTIKRWQDGQNEAAAAVSISFRANGSTATHDSARAVSTKAEGSSNLSSHHQLPWLTRLLVLAQLMYPGVNVAY